MNTEEFQQLMKNPELDMQLQELFECQGTCDLKGNLLEKSKEELTPLLWWAVLHDKPLVFDFLIKLGAEVDGEELMNAAASIGSIPFVEKLLNLGFSVDSRCRDLRTPLHYAAVKGRQEMVHWLIGKGADLYAVDKDGRNVLHAAFSDAPNDENLEEMNNLINYFIEQGVDIAKKNLDQLTPLGVALMKGWTEFAKVLIEKEPSLIEQPDSEGFTPLHSAAFYGRSNIVELLLKKKVAIDPQDKYQNTPLITAAKRGHQEIVETLLAHGANIEAKNIDGFTPLQAAAWGGNKKIISSLLDHGAEIDTTDKYGCTTLFAAISIGDFDLVQFLLERGANINIKDFESWTPLMKAASWGHQEIASFLIERGADIHAVGKTGVTLLHIASGLMNDKAGKEPLEQLAIWLIEQGLNIHAKTDLEELPLHYAARYCSKLVKLYIEKGANAKALGQYERTPLHYACYQGNGETSCLLINAGVPIDHPDDEGYTALHFACISGNKSLVLDMLEHNVTLDPPQIEIGSPLFDAVQKGWLDVTERLIENGADINRLTVFGKTAYEIAMHHGHSEIAELLARKMTGADCK